MKRLCFLVLFFLCLKAHAKPPVPGDWQLVFSDDFDNLNTQTWNLVQPNGNLKLGNSKAYFLPENIQVANGNLLIISKKEKPKIKIVDQDGKTHKVKYTSGYIDSFEKFTQTYGYFEARMKMPHVKGLWPAFWLMPDRGMKPGAKLNIVRSTYIENGEEGYYGKGMEIDIMEHLSKWGPKYYHYATHWDGYGKDLKNYGDKYKLPQTVSSDGYIKFGIYWAANLLVWYADDVEIMRWENTRIADVPMYIIFNTAMGGWAGRIRARKLPDTTYVDYVKVWALVPANDPTI